MKKLFTIKKELTKTTKVNGTGKTLNLYVTYGEKDENYTGKFTVRVYGKKTNKLYKTLVEEVTVKVPEKEDTEGIEQGKKEGLIDQTLDFLNDLGAVPEDLKEKISEEKNLDVLKRWVKLSARVSTVNEFREKM